MPDNNGNLTDKLSVEISASVDPAIKAIDSLQTKLNLLSGSLQHFTDAGKYKSALDNMASGFERLNQVVGAIDTGRIASTAKAVGAMGGSFEKVAKSALTFQEALGGFEKTPKTIADVVGEQMTSVLDEFGITAKKDVDLVISEFTKLGESVSRGVWDEDLEEKFINAQNALQGVATVAKETTQTYAGLLEYIRSFPKASVHLPQEVVAEYPDNAWLGKAKTAGGNIFTTSGGTDFSVFLSELNSQLGNIIPMTGNAADEFTALTNAMRIARDEAEELKNGGSRVGISMNEAGDATYQAMTNIQEALKGLDGSETVEKLVSPFNDMKTALQELSTITIPDFSGLNSLTTLAGKIGNEKGAAVGENLARIVESLRGISGDVSIPDFSSLKALGDGISKLGYKTATQGAQNIPIIAKALTELSFAQIPSDFTALAGLAEAIHALGLSSAQKAAQNIPQLAQALNDLITSLAEMPEVSDKTLRLVEALGQLDGANMKVANSTNHVAKGHNVASQAIQKFTSRVSSAYNNSNFLATAYNKVKDGVSGFARSMDKATSHTQSLTMVIVKARTLLWGFRRIFSMFSGSLELASSLVEVQNVIDNVFTENYAKKIEDMSKTVKDSLGMSELSFKQYASRYQAMGKAMGITNSQMISAQDKLKGMGVAYGEANGNMQDMSVNLTRLAADLASFYDIDQKTAFEKLQAVYTGQTRPLRALGIDLTQATLQEWALKHGIDADIQSMTQAEKTMLRYQYVLAQTTSAHGDYARTIRSWHNQIILLKENFKELGIIVGSGLIQAIKPFVMAMNAAFKAVLTFSTNVLNALGQIFGWKVETFARGSSLEDFADSLDDVSSGIGDTASGADDTASGLEKADKAAKKLKATVLGFDELNILNGNDEDTVTTSGSGSGAGSGTGGLGSGVGGIGDGGIGDIDYVLKKTDSKFKSAIDNLYDLGKYISDSLAKVLDGINWNKVYKKAENFGIGLADFLNGLVQPHTFASLGKTVGNSINTAMKSLDSFAYTFNFYNLGRCIALGVKTALGSINWNWVQNAAVSWGYGLGAFLNGLIDVRMFTMLGDSVANALNAAVVGAIAFNEVLNGENIGKAFGALINHALGGIKWESVLTEAQLLAEDISQAINAFCTPENFGAVGTAVGKGVGTAIKFAFELGDGIDFVQLGESFNTFLHTALDNINSDDVANTINTWIYGALDFLGEVDMQYIVEKIFEVMSKIDWGAAANLKLELDEIQAATSIASGIASAFDTNPVKGIISAAISGLGTVATAAVAGWGFRMGLAGTSAGASAVGTVGGTTGLLGVFGTGLGALPGLLAAAAPPILAGILVVAGILGMSDPRVQRKIEEGKVALDKFRNDENKNWSLSYQNMSGTASDYSKQIENTVKTTNNGIKSSYDSTTSKAQTDVETANAEIKRSYDSLGREIGYSVNGEYGQAMDDMRSIGERAAEGLKNALQSVTDFLDGWDFPTWHLEWEQHEEGGYGFSLPKIVRYASGGFPDAGLFFANEYGNPEMIGTIGRRPAVANNDQITTAIRGAVVDGMMQVFMATGGMGGNGGSPTVEVTVKADSETLYRTVRRGEQKYNRRYSVVAQM